ncbi:MAG: tetratricopeptide repeat protein [Myxococcota bacterium]|nr:tetratricopeptide repeat protein [Myxococcota bacterium]
MDLAQFTASLRNHRPRASRPVTLEAIYATAHWLLTRERFADAAKVFRVMLQIAPRDERAWLGLGECHERVEQPRIAAELYGAGSVIAGGAQNLSVRCLIARARMMSRLGRGVEVDGILDTAERAAVEQADEHLVEFVACERRRLS